MNVSLLKLATVLFSVLCTTLMGYGVFAADFPANAGSLGAIPDYPAGPLCHTSGWIDKNVTFTVSGISGAPSNVEIKNLTFSPTHTWAGDISALLIAPGGSPTASVFGRIGATTATGAGTASDLTGPYGFRNPADPNIWTVQATNPIPSNTYTATISGGLGTTNPAATVNLDTAFAGVANPNGTWTLRFRDGCDGDIGSVSAVTLTVDGAAVPANAPHDINGDGRSDFIIVRADGAPLGEYMGANDFAGKDKVANNERQAKSAVPQVGVGWWTALNNGSMPTRVDHGADTDFFVMEDFDGDGRDDLTVYSPGAATVAAFRILRSSNSTVLTIPYGQTGDDPSVVGDWNNDNVADLAVYRDGTGGSPQSFFFWTSIATPSVVNYLPWGQDGDIGFALDYDGDGRLDPAIQRNSAGAGIFWISRSSNGAAVTFQYGLASDFVVPGDYDGDGRDDIVVSRNANFGAGTFKYFWILESDGGGAPNTPQQWGIPGDFICQGDYDGDGRTDLGVWRSNADPSQNYFYARRSSDGATHQFEWGQSGDYPVNNWNVH